MTRRADRARGPAARPCAAGPHAHPAAGSVRDAVSSLRPDRVCVCDRGGQRRRGHTRLGPQPRGDAPAPLPCGRGSRAARCAGGIVGRPGSPLRSSSPRRLAGTPAGRKAPGCRDASQGKQSSAARASPRIRSGVSGGDKQSQHGQREYEEVYAWRRWLTLWTGRPIICSSEHPLWLGSSPTRFKALTCRGVDPALRAKDY